MHPRMILAVALLLGGCGLLSPTSMEPLPDPGKGPFRDEGAIEVCVGVARVNSKGSEPLGVCVEASRQAGACGEGAGCGAGEQCSCGRCVVAACRDASACPGEQLCRGGLCAPACEDASSCQPGEVCDSGGCSRPCAGDASCGFGARCDLLSGLCVAETCVADGACGQGRACVPLERPIELHEPSWLAGGAAVLLEGRERRGPQEVRRIYRASVEQAHRFRLDEQPLPLGEQDIEAPSSLLRGGELDVYGAAGGKIVRYRADPGFTRVEGPEVVLEASEAWEGGRVASPAVVAFRGQVHLFYEVGERAGLGHARLDEGGRVVARSLLLTAAQVEAPGRWQQVSQVGAPDAVVAGDLLLVYFTARGVEGGSAYQGETEQPADSNDSLGLLASEDGASFDRGSGPLFARRTNLRTYLGERESALLLREGGSDLLFLATDAAGSIAGLARATSP